MWENYYYPYCDARQACNPCKKCCDVNVCNKIEVTVNASSTGGSGGDGGDTGCTVAAAATGLGLNIIDCCPEDAQATLPEETNEPNATEEQPKAEDVDTLQDGTETATATAVGGIGGAGGAGGAASLTQIIGASIDNWTIVCCGNSGGAAGDFKISTDGKITDIKLDENGDIHLNGEKMDVKTLDNGTRVFILNNKTQVEKENVE